MSRISKKQAEAIRAAEQAKTEQQMMEAFQKIGTDFEEFKKYVFWKMRTAHTDGYMEARRDAIQPRW
jgi:hypothetical protein